MHFTDLEAKKDELKGENAELKNKNAEIPDLKRKFAEIESEKVELKARIAKLLRQAVEESKRRDVENAEFKARIEELKKNKTVPLNSSLRMLSLEIGSQKWSRSRC